MKRILLYLVVVCVIVSCKKDMPEPPTVSGGGYGTASIYTNYDVTFWSDGPGNVITVSMNGQSGTISYWYNYMVPCQAMGCANFSVPPGTYTYTASTASGASWGGTITTTGGPQCVTILFH